MQNLLDQHFTLQQVRVGNTSKIFSCLTSVFSLCLPSSSILFFKQTFYTIKPHTDNKSRRAVKLSNRHVVDYDEGGFLRRMDITMGPTECRSCGVRPAHYICCTRFRGSALPGWQTPTKQDPASTSLFVGRAAGFGDRRARKAEFGADLPISSVCC